LYKQDELFFQKKEKKRRHDIRYIKVLVSRLYIYYENTLKTYNIYYLIIFAYYFSIKICEETKFNVSLLDFAFEI